MPRNRKAKAKSSPSTKVDGSKSTTQPPVVKKQNMVIRPPTANVQRLTKEGTAIARRLLNPTTLSPIIASFALPCDYPVVRIRNSYAADPTAVANPFTSFAYNATVAASTSANLGYASILMFRDVLRSYATFLPASPTYQYNLLFYNSSTNAEGDNVVFNWRFATVNLLPIAYAQNSVGFAPHGQVLYCGTHQNRRGIWLNINDTITFTSSNTADIMVYYLSGAQWTIINSVAITTSAVVGPTTTAGYYAFEIAAPAVSAGAGTLTGVLANSGGDVWGFNPIPNVASKQVSLTGVRVGAFSFLMTNTASDLNASGTIVAAQFNNGLDWVRSIGEGFASVLSTISATSGSYSGAAKMGCYGFAKPVNVGDLDFQLPFMADSASGAITTWDFPLVSKSPIVWTVANTAVVGGSYPGSSFQATLHYGVEFTTYDPWFEKLPPVGSSAVFDEAMTALSMLPQFYENPIHWADIAAFIKKAASVVPGMLGIASEAFPVLKPAAAIANVVGPAVESLL